MLNARCKLPVAMRLTQLAMCLSAAFALDHDALAGTVTDCGDTGGANQLRHMVAIAASGENISVSQCSTITLTNGEIASSLSRLRITGSSGSPTVISGNDSSRVINHTGTGGYLLLRDVTIQNGNRTAASAYGGCIYSSAPIVSLDHMKLQNCNATETSAAGFAKGGGLFALHFVDMRNSTVTGNTATQQSSNFIKAMGGGIYAETLSMFNSTVTLNDATSSVAGSTHKYTEAGGIFTMSTARIYSSTIANNYAGKYGAMFLATAGTGSVTIANSTISSNSALHHTGGMRENAASFVLANSTIAFNYSVEAAGTGGVYAAGGVTLRSSIIARNQAGLSESDLNVTGAIDPASANNLIITSNIPTPADTIKTEPHLLPLANNGGYTKTHALRHDSPALNRGNNVFEFSNFTPLTCDQRGNQNVPQLNPPNTDNCNMVNGGFLRVDSDPLHSLPDIGAYEEQLPNADWIFYDGLEGNYL